MYLNQRTNFWHSLAFRLSLWYTLIFSISSAIAFYIIFTIAASILLQNTDDELLEDVEEMFQLYTKEGLDGLKEEFETEAESDGAENVFYRLMSASGSVRLQTDLSDWRHVPSSEVVVRNLLSSENPLFQTLDFDHLEHKARVIQSKLANGDILQIGESLEENDEFLSVLRDVFFLILPFILAIAIIGGWFMGRKALSGLNAVTTTAIEISNGQLNHRVPLTGRGDEIDKLAHIFNLMLDRIQSLIAGMRDMTDNIAHDLRSPLARIRGVAESAITTQPTMEAYQTVAANTIEECDRLIHMINTMLDITETEAGVAIQTMDKVNMVRVIHDACDLFQPIAEDRCITLSESIQGDVDVTVYGNKHFLQRVIANLIDNALKYTPKGGSVSVGLTKTDREVIVHVRDTGVGISDAERTHIFERFYRGDQSRSA